MKSCKVSIVLPALIILISLGLAIFLYPQMPDFMASHWGINGQVDGFSSKKFNLFFMPVLSIFMLILFRLLPATDPYKRNFSKFAYFYQTFVNLVFIFLFYTYLLVLIWNLGVSFNMIQLLSPAFAILFFYAGILLEHTKRNWFVGIRTPWTMTSKKVWKKTHQLGSKLFKITAIINLFSIFLPQFAFYFILVPTLFTVIFIFIYSYLEYQKEIKK